MCYLFITGRAMSEVVTLLKQQLEPYLTSSLLLPVTGAVATAVLCWCLTRGPTPHKSPVDINKQSIDIGVGAFLNLKPAEQSIV